MTNGAGDHGRRSEKDGASKKVKGKDPKVPLKPKQVPPSRRGKQE